MQKPATLLWANSTLAKKEMEKAIPFPTATQETMNKFYQGDKRNLQWKFQDTEERCWRWHHNVGDVSCSWIGRGNIKISILLRVVCIACLHKSLVPFITWIEKTHKIHIQAQTSLVSPSPCEQRWQSWLHVHSGATVTKAAAVLSKGGSLLPPTYICLRRPMSVWDIGNSDACLLLGR